MNVQKIELNGKPQFAVLPWAEYEKLLDALDKTQDMIDAQEAQDYIERVRSGEEETFPAALVHAILDGENRVRAYRKHRKMTQGALAKKAGISVAFLSQIESDKRKGTRETLLALAKALNIDLDNLKPQ